MTFTSKQKEILEIAKKKGFITLEDMSGVFSSPISRKANLERFMVLGIFIAENEKFKLDPEKLRELE